MLESYDIAVIGAGPAGASAALRAAMLGARVLLLEKQPMPRPKLCGGWVSRQALGHLGFTLPKRIVECPFDAIELCSGAHRTRFAPEEPLGVFVDRAQFDHYLVGQAVSAGVELRCEKAVSLERAGPMTVIRTDGGRHTARAVVIATGAVGGLIRQVRSLDGAAEQGICLEQRLPVEHADALGVKPGTARIVYGAVPFGFGWVLHHGEYLLVGIGGLRAKLPDPRAAYDSFWHSLDLPPELQHFRGHLIPLGGVRRVLGHRRWLLAGDAAGLVDAFTGEGIPYAIRSGQLAAAVLSAVTDDCATAVYARSCRQEFGPRLRLSLWLARAHRAAPNLLPQMFCSDPRLPRMYHEVFEGRMAVSAFLPRMVRHVLRLGWRR